MTSIVKSDLPRAQGFIPETKKIYEELIKDGYITVLQGNCMIILHSFRSCGIKVTEIVSQWIIIY